MNSPYTSHPLDAFMAAETAVGIALTAIVWAKPLASKLASLILVAAVWVAVLEPIVADLVKEVGLAPSADLGVTLLRIVAVLAGTAAVLSRRWAVGTLGLVGAVVLWWMRDRIVSSDGDFAGAELAFIGLLLGVHARTSRSAPTPTTDGPVPPPRLSFVGDDARLFALSVGLGAFVATYVQNRHTDSGDEWAYTYQAALFLKGKAFEVVVHCGEAFRNFWVYHYEGRSFAQYTPGWPLFMAPFLGLGVVWIAGSFALGLLVVAVARLSRRAFAGVSNGSLPPSRRDVRAAGLFGGLALMLGSTMLINAGSRYPHVFVAAMYAWCVELLFSITDSELTTKQQWTRGLLLGAAAAMLLATRPVDGCTLGVGLAVYFAYALTRRTIARRALGGTFVSFALLGGLTLVILHAQIGEWFRTGYSLTEIYYPWNKLSFSVPEPDELRAGFPLATGSYCWWPCSPALGFLGLAMLRGRAARIAVVIVLSFVPLLTFYAMCEIGRHGDFGYGPRYQFACVVPMAIGTSRIVTELWARAHRQARGMSAFTAAGPVACLLLAAVVGTVRIAVLVYPSNIADVRDHNILADAIAKGHPKKTLVLARDGIANIDSLDLPENLPISLYPDQDVLIARTVSDESDKCLRAFYDDRTIVIAEKKGAGVELRPDYVR